MNADFFLKVAKFKIGSLSSAEDFSDKFHYQISTSIVIMAITLIAIRQYIFTPIQCWIPPEWARGWEEFAENYCYVQDTYFANTKDGPPKESDARERLKINYYQWVPFVLALQAMLFYLPHIIWKVLSTRTGVSVNHLVRFACDAATFDHSKRLKILKYLSSELFRLMEMKREDIHRRGPWRQITNRVNSVFPFYVFGKRSGYLLVVIYIFVKFIYIAVDFGQLYLMKSFIGQNSIFYGLPMLLNVTGNNTWDVTGVFPRVTWCDVRRKVIANSQMNSFMCVLPLNLLNEKMYIFLWFWVVLGLILSIVSLITWIIRMANVRSRRMFVKKYLRILEVIADDEAEACKLFVNQFLGHNGIFILTMIAQNAGEVVAAETVSGVWQLWKEQRNLLMYHLPTPARIIDNAPEEKPDSLLEVKKRKNSQDD